MDNNKVNTVQHSRLNQGQGLVEYAIILSMVAVVVTASLSAAGPAVGNIFSNIVDHLGGVAMAAPAPGTGSSAPGSIPEVTEEAPAATEEPVVTEEPPAGPSFDQLRAEVTICVTNNGARNSLSNAASNENLSTFKTLLSAHQSKLSSTCYTTLSNMANSMG